MSDDTKRCGGGTLPAPTPSDVLEALRGTRLGKHERRLLLTVQSWQSFPRRVEPPAPGRSADESHRRALRRLVALGLLTRHGDIVQTECGTRYATAVSLTALGGAVREVCERELEAGATSASTPSAPATSSPP
jgi:hypothetical protein